jgi:hypothetical protein
MARCYMPRMWPWWTRVPMAELISDMEWLYHVDLDLAKHVDADEVARNARQAFVFLQGRQQLQPGDHLIIAIVRPRKPEAA